MGHVMWRNYTYIRPGFAISSMSSKRRRRRSRLSVIKSAFVYNMHQQQLLLLVLVALLNSCRHQFRHNPHIPERVLGWEWKPISTRRSVSRVSNFSILPILRRPNTGRRAEWFSVTAEELWGVGWLLVSLQSVSLAAFGLPNFIHKYLSLCAGFVLLLLLIPPPQEHILCSIDNVDGSLLLLGEPSRRGFIYLWMHIVGTWGLILYDCISTTRCHWIGIRFHFLGGQVCDTFSLIRLNCWGSLLCHKRCLEVLWDTVIGNGEID